MATAEPLAEPPRGRYLATLTLGALGVVYGDIGTSPLYAIRECFFGEHAIAVTEPNVLGVLSLIVWSLVIVITVKYLGFIMRADNRGEGGILALMALVRGGKGSRRAHHFTLVALGLFGAALLYGDGMITPAISVLSAVEGLEVATPAMDPYIIPTTAVILVALFLFQRRGTGGVGAVFGPVTLAWFAVLAVLGASSLVQEPRVLAAIDPLHALDFVLRNRWTGFLVLGAVFLVVTGGEALYADMGHFGKRPIRLAWLAVVLPALLLNYFGQGALLLRNPEAAHNPFYRLAPSWALYPLVVLATAATVIASQAVISGAFSLTRQAVQLGYSPRLRIDHTSPEEIGQVYLPPVNWVLMISTIGLVFAFGSSSNLAAAYGMAVTTTMVITTILFYVVARELWGWGRPAALAVTLFFLVPDLSFFGANLSKITHGGWFPLVIAAGIFLLMSTWERGRELLAVRLHSSSIPLGRFWEGITVNPPARVPGTAVFLTGDAEGVPRSLLHNLKHNKVLHERVVLLTVLSEEIPRVAPRDSVEVLDLGNGFFRVTGHCGFLEDPNVPRLLERAALQGFDYRPLATTFFLGRETILATDRPGMALWREKLFAFMARNALNATAFFHLPTNQVVELGSQVDI